MAALSDAAGALLGMQGGSGGTTGTGGSAGAEQESSEVAGEAETEPPIDTQTSALTEKELAARAIKYGCPETDSNLKRWHGTATSKPGLKELRAEVTRRDITAKPKHWDVPTLVAWLTKKGHEPPAEGQQVPSATSTTATTPASQQGSASGEKVTKKRKTKKGSTQNDQPPTTRWKANHRPPATAPSLAAPADLT